MRVTILCPTLTSLEKRRVMPLQEVGEVILIKDYEGTMMCMDK